MFVRLNHFLQDVGEAIWEGVQAIGAFFAEDVVGFINDAVDAVGEWVRKNGVLRSLLPQYSSPSTNRLLSC